MKAGIVISFVCAAVLAIGVGQVSTIAGNRPPEQSSSGPDVVLSSIPNVNRWGPVNNIYAYSIGSATCNIGNQNLAWEQLGTPGLAMNAYRLHDGRLQQIGLSWVKHAWTAVIDGSCSGMSCNGVDGSQLGAGCLDIYSANWNAGQKRLGPRTGINPHTGQFSSFSTNTGDAIYKRLQIHRHDVDQSVYGDALYFVEGVYVATDDAQSGNNHNNATYRRVTITPASKDMNLAAQESTGMPAIFAWRDHGNGVNNPDPSVEIITVDLPNEGRFFAASKVEDNGNGTWRYEYAVYNLTSHQAAGTFTVEIGNGAEITNVGFHAPFYHSGENQSNAPWQHHISSDAVTWSTTQTHAQNPNANAIRWGTMYNFWFDADQPPVTRTADIGVFIPGTDSGVTFASRGPDDAAIPCPADLNGNGIVDGEDLLILLSEWGPCAGCDSDLNNDGVVDGEDLLILLSEWGECP